ncbi:hypothetical protein AB1A81_11195 [Bdellovibrio bacteriovorus]|uniref:Uncharacterized protein n=1 Tax=Bdellovibrio bacteriovorus (strain ATCC 15356 / DSM 50701 / NCIMB 9529 / HD100) TaxID=264462 RepID=Q6MKF4_BDEBA|nr:hypothetical protein [Bdellovibrio bacteriovorus]CAE80253.1 hypothetical protein predicted by Glimmer/Critica [Bdellovibrio bacteriovorus HD100]
MAQVYEMTARALMALALVAALTACSMEANISLLPEILKDPPAPDMKTQRTETDFVAGEIVTTGNGVVITGSFGEISEKQVLANGVQVEGAFYE